jgi:lipoate-protein ligase A
MEDRESIIKFEIVKLPFCSIYEQLHLEEGLLRADHRNFCIFSQGSIEPAVVLGISNQPTLLVNQMERERQGVDLIRRFTGGGAVIVDENTLFVTFIGQADVLRNYPCTPRGIMHWAEEIFKPLFSHLSFSLQENDFAIGERKCAGNAQYLQRGRFLLHTSFLWDYSGERMKILLQPEVAPLYRKGRRHEEFLCRLQEHFSSKEEFFRQLKVEIEQRFSLQNIDQATCLKTLSSRTYRKATTYLE